MTYIGDLPRFWGHENFDLFNERLEQVFELNGLSDEKKVALLILSVGDEVQRTVRDACHPLKPKDKTFDELQDLVKKQYVSDVSAVDDRRNFYRAKQSDDESVQQWFTRIQSLTVNCKFGNHFGNVLLIRFINGLKSSAVLDRVCEEKEDELNIERALEVAMAKETEILNNKNTD